MNAVPATWREWAQILHRLKMQAWVATLLEAAGPLTILFAQVVYLGQPLLKRAVPQGHLDALAQMLEDSAQTHAFTKYLREDMPQ